MLCDGSSSVFSRDKDGTADENSKVQLEFRDGGGGDGEAGLREKVRTESSTITHNLQLCHFFVSPLLGDSCST